MSDRSCPLCKRRHQIAEEWGLEVWYPHYQAHAHASCVVAEADTLRATVARLTAERDAARAEAERLRPFAAMIADRDAPVGPDYPDDATTYIEYTIAEVRAARAALAGGEGGEGA